MAKNLQKKAPRMEVLSILGHASEAARDSASAKEEGVHLHPLRVQF